MAAAQLAHAPRFEIEFELVGIGRRTVTTSGATPGQAITAASAELRATTSRDVAIVCHGHRRITE